MNRFLAVFLVLFVGSLYAQTPSSREFVYNLNLSNALSLNPSIGFGLEYGIKDKVNFINNVQPRKKGGYNLTVNQLILGLNAELLYQWKQQDDVLSSLTIEYRKTGKTRNQFQIGAGPGYMFSFKSDVSEIKHPAEPFLNGPVIEYQLAPMAFVGLGKYRTGKRILQFWHVRFSSYVPVTNFRNPVMLVSLRLGMHKRPIA